MPAKEKYLTSMLLSLCTKIALCEKQIRRAEDKQNRREMKLALFQKKNRNTNESVMGQKCTRYQKGHFPYSMHEKAENGREKISKPPDP